ncbi:type II secretion system F family protein [uncultured Subdoligranulum sp.]|uniref:type II secretion system F family protein n=1 Tax=uncultured Subdoligranulum sp. TaxID=512298 RepID=UPI0032091D17
MMIKVIFLAIGTVISVFYILLLLLGSRYDSKIEGLPQEGYSDKELFSAGYLLQYRVPWLSMKSKMGQKLMAQAQILHPENQGRFAEYWARLYWARTLSLSILVMAFVFCAAAWMEGIMVYATLLVGVVGVYAVYNQGANEMANQIKKRSTACLLEFSNVVSKLALLLNCNETIIEAWRTVAYSKTGPIYDLMQDASVDMDNNVPLESAIYNFGVRTASPEIRKFASIIIQNAARGGSDMTVFMRQQAQEMGARRRQLMLQRGDEAAARLLIPTTLILIGIMAIILVAALANMNLSL